MNYEFNEFIMNLCIIKRLSELDIASCYYIEGGN